MGQNITSVMILVIAFLAISVVAALIMKKIRFPYTIGLVLVGIGVGLSVNQVDSLSILQALQFTPEMILYIILPTLIFSSAIDIDISLLRKNIVPILSLAVIAVLISTAIITGIHWMIPISLGGALVFGALISATDPVAVITLFKEVGAPRRLTTLIDGESLFNNATAIVLYNIIGASVFVVASGEFADVPDVGKVITSFVMVLCGGAVIGVIIGLFSSVALRIGRNDIVLQITVSLIMAYVSFILADRLHFSGVMASLAAGLVFRLRSESVIDRSNIETVEQFWDYFAFVANSFLFLLLGVAEVHNFQNTTNPHEIIMAIAIVVPIVLLARFAGVFWLIPVYNLFHRKEEKVQIPLPYQIVIFWGGLRGAVPVALMLAIPMNYEDRQLIIHLTMGYVLFTLLIQGTTTKALMNILGIQSEKTDFAERETVHRDVPIKSEGLGHLIFHGMKKLFEEEGFLVRDRSDETFKDMLMTRGKVALHIHYESEILSMTSEPKNMSYLTTVLSETIRDLNLSMQAIGEVFSTDTLQGLVHGDSNTELGIDLMRYFTRKMMVVPLVSSDKEGILREMLQILAHRKAIKNYPEVLAEVLERESSMSTGIGMGIAMPHARSEYVTDMTVLMGVHPKGIDFESLDGKPVSIFILIISPKNDNGPHLQMISAVSKLLMNEELREKMISCEESYQLYALIEEAVRNG